MQVIYVSGLFQEHILIWLTPLIHHLVHQPCWWLYHIGVGFEARLFLPWQAPKSAPVPRRAVPATSDSQGMNSLYHHSIHSSYCEQRQELGATSSLFSHTPSAAEPHCLQGLLGFWSRENAGVSHVALPHPLEYGQELCHPYVAWYVEVVCSVFEKQMRTLLKMSYTHRLEKDHFHKISPKYKFLLIKQILYYSIPRSWNLVTCKEIGTMCHPYFVFSFIVLYHSGIHCFKIFSLTFFLP